jgi:hypothetical protein
LYGVLLKNLNDLNNCPLDNYHATISKLTGISRLIKDALSEMEQLLASEEIEEALDEEDDEDDFGLDQLTAADKEILPPFIILIKSAGGVFTSLSKSIREISPTKEGLYDYNCNRRLKKFLCSKTMNFCLQLDWKECFLMRKNTKLVVG